MNGPVFVCLEYAEMTIRYLIVCTDVIFYYKVLLVLHFTAGSWQCKM